MQTLFLETLNFLAEYQVDYNSAICDPSGFTILLKHGLKVQGRCDYLTLQTTSRSQQVVSSSYVRLSVEVGGKDKIFHSQVAGFSAKALMEDIFRVTALVEDFTKGCPNAN
jgi:hypothetical protein